MQLFHVSMIVYRFATDRSRRIRNDANKEIRMLRFYLERMEIMK